MNNTYNDDDYKFILDGSVFNYKDYYKNNIPVEEMNTKDIKIFKKVLTEIANELNIVIDPLYSRKYEYWYAGLFTDKLSEVVQLMNKKGLTYE
jgi:hypothetical protein